MRKSLRKKKKNCALSLSLPLSVRLRIYLILEEIAKLENITVTDQNESLPGKVMEFLLKEAKWTDPK